jgi:hypothetical protein
MRRKLATVGIAAVLSMIFSVVATPGYAAPGHATATSTTEQALFHAGGTAANSLPYKLLGPPPGSCSYQHLCLFKDALYSGDRIDLFYCGYVNLFWERLSMWREISSLVNNQTIGTVSAFYETSSSRNPLFWETAYGYRDNLAVDGWNDQIGYIHVC